MNRNKLILFFALLSLISLNGCAKIWSPVFYTGKKVNPAYYKKATYYNGPHQLCSYQGRHVHDPELGPVSIKETDEKKIREKYRYPGMEDQFKEMDERVW